MTARHGRPSRRAVIGSLLAVPAIVSARRALGAARAPAGRVVIGWHVTIAPSWADPSTAPPNITPFGVLYAVHDALVRPYPGEKMGPSLAQSWHESEDGRTYEFTLRPGLAFHNGDPLSAEDVKFSFERYNGGAAALFKEKVARVEIVDPRVVRFHLHEVWPDFMTFYGTTASAAGFVVPKKYLEKVGDDGFRKHPVGAGPYKFVGSTAGIEVAFEAFDGYWRHPPLVKSLIMRSVPEATTRALMVKTGEIDIGYALDGVEAEGVKNDPRTHIEATNHASNFWIEFPDQYDPKSPWHDKRLRLAVNYALDRSGINQAACLGFCTPTGNIVPRVMEFALPVEPPAYDPRKARQLLAEAGYPNGIDAGDFHAIPGFPTAAQAVVNDLLAVGIRVKLMQMERAAFTASWKARKLRGLFMTASGSAGNAASRIEAFVQSKGSFASGGYPGIDALFQQQAVEPDRRKREVLLHQIQQLAIDRVMFAQVMDRISLVGIGPRIARSTIGDVYLNPFPSYEDIEIKG
jgi:peptide/nickel transport system substrate-binding protein